MTSKPSYRPKQAISTSIAANHPYRHQKPSTSRTVLKQTGNLWAWWLLMIIFIGATMLIAYILITGNSSLEGSVIPFADTVVLAMVPATVAIVKIEQKSSPTSD